MDKEKTIKEVVEEVEKASTTFEKTNTELKRKYLKWNIEAFIINRLPDLDMWLVCEDGKIGIKKINSTSTR